MKLEEIEIEKIRPNPANVRMDAENDPTLERLADEIGTMGVVTPILVYPHPDIDGDYMVQEGHRRRLAALRAGLSTMPCLVLDAPARGELADLEVMMTTGRNHKPLNVLEEAHGFQRMLDLGLSESTIGKKFKKPKSEILTKARLTKAPEPIQDAYSFGRLDLLDVKKLQDLEDQGATGIVDRVVEEIARNEKMKYRTNVAHKIADAERRQRGETNQQRLDEAGAKQAPNDASYNGKFARATDLDSDAEHISAGHLYMIDFDGETTWWAPLKKAVEVSEEEKAEKQRIRALNGGLGISFRVREQFLVDQVRKKDGGVSEKQDTALLLDALWSDIRRLDDHLLGDVVGIMPPDGDMWTEAYTDWTERCRKKLAAFTWRQLARLAAVAKHRDLDKKLRTTGGFDRVGRSEYGSNEGVWRHRADWYRLLQDGFGYRLDQSEQDALAWAIDKAGESRDLANDVEVRDADH
ncbi:ParB/RepB/Spo0J family partition protein [Zhihengliuella sp.]|uniref:ParB/RepB/Spo0J family partition protein n=1 Tax=Zhihengliuella sp. TaxID=1954483 RepID=UPI00281121C7|nr:ParB/RepB/Spo0J family partition protein [Zhihengliuella sp.]